MEPDKQHFIGIVDANRGIIKSLCQAYHNDLEDQRDAFQDIVLQLWKSFPTFRGDSEIGTWVYRVSLNTLLARVRQQKRRIITEPVSDSELIRTSARADGDRELLYQIIQSLKDVDKAIVILYLEGYKNREIAHMLNLTATNISTRMNRIRTELKLKFKTQHDEVGQP